MSGEGASLPAGATESNPAPAIRGFFSPPALAELIRDLYMD